jgi:hypothetical protein
MQLKEKELESKEIEIKFLERCLQLGRSNENLEESLTNKITVCSEIFILKLLLLTFHKSIFENALFHL